MLEEYILMNAKVMMAGLCIIMLVCAYVLLRTRKNG